MTTYDRPSINRAFRELGLRFQWDERDWAVLSTLTDLRAQLGYWLPRHHPHLLKVYDVDLLAAMVGERLACPGGGCHAIEAREAA